MQFGQFKGTGVVDHNRYETPYFLGTRPRSHSFKYCLKLDGIEQSGAVQQMLCLGIYNCNRALSAIGDNAANIFILQQKCRSAKYQGYCQRGNSQTPG